MCLIVFLSDDRLNRSGNPCLVIKLYSKAVDLLSKSGMSDVTHAPLGLNPFSPMTLGPMAFSPLPLGHGLTLSHTHFVQSHLVFFHLVPLLFSPSDGGVQ